MYKLKILKLNIAYCVVRNAFFSIKSNSSKNPIHAINDTIFEIFS